MPTSIAHNRIFLVALAAACVAAGCRSRRAPGTAIQVVPSAPPTYAANTIVAGVPIAGLTQEAAAKVLRERLKPLGAKPLILTYGAHSYHRVWREAGIAPDVDGMLARAWQVASVPLALSVNVPTAATSIRRAARALNVAPVPPHFVGPPSKGWIKPERTGRRVDVGATAILLREAARTDTALGQSPLVVLPNEPDFTAGDLAPINVKLVAYTTRFNPRDWNRTHNLKLVSRMLNGAYVKPGAVFSFNDWVGERNASDGFREAIVYKYGKLEKETGGGLCQVSSTLYNVALLAGLAIKQRSHHSLTVHYVPLGRDASVYWGRQDLRFENNTSAPIYIHTRVNRSSLTIEAWGTAPMGRRVQITSTAGWKGGKATARVYRTIAVNGGKTRELVSDDVYDTRHVMAGKPARPRRT